MGSSGSLSCGARALGGTRRVGGLLGVAGRLSGTVSPFRAEQGTSLVWKSVGTKHHVEKDREMDIGPCKFKVCS